MAAARLGAAADLVTRLHAAGLSRVLIAAEDSTARQALRDAGGELLQGWPKPFHFGRVLAWIADRAGAPSLAYFGGASAPLATPAVLESWLRQWQGLPQGSALVNNVHSSDWALLSDTAALRSAGERLDSDNALGWILREELKVQVAEPPRSAASHADIDTPGDLALMRLHPGIGPRLGEALDPFPVELARRTEAILRLLRAEASSLALIGRVSAEVWMELVRATRIWVRVYAEERGMRASGRQARGEVRSLVGDLVDRLGPIEFLGSLATLAQGALWDTRVWMAQRGRWPSAADRMASDLGWVDHVGQEDVRRLTEAIIQSGLPILTGGHGIVAGSLLAMVESLGTIQP
ncbi:MAG TPA: hypothetical protein VLL77_04705 [Anaerolineales bacterium]|nr:hypothetical protein [Anaerolineales bacterium]